MYYDEVRRIWVDDKLEQKATREELIIRMVQSKKTRFPIEITLIEPLSAEGFSPREYLFESSITKKGITTQTWRAI